jgi:hypothetical protein
MFVMMVDIIICSDRATMTGMHINDGSAFTRNDQG